ncbi:hypothetical protein C8J56DRAFT_1066725 [Mycena floridula]|nr:hypothetical protein C8J56DRAFT_1066725 [Mycena floridula]
MARKPFGFHIRLFSPIFQFSAQFQAFSLAVVASFCSRGSRTLAHCLEGTESLNLCPRAALSQGISRSLVVGIAYYRSEFTLAGRFHIFVFLFLVHIPIKFTSLSTIMPLFFCAHPSPIDSITEKLDAPELSSTQMGEKAAAAVFAAGISRVGDQHVTLPSPTSEPFEEGDPEDVFPPAETSTSGSAPTLISWSEPNVDSPSLGHLDSSFIDMLAAGSTAVSSARLSLHISIVARPFYGIYAQLLLG